jgi:hypothetical protein
MASAHEYLWALVAPVDDEELQRAVVTLRDTDVARYRALGAALERLLALVLAAGLPPPHSL